MATLEENNAERKFTEIQIAQQKVDSNGIPLPSVLVPSPGHRQNAKVDEFLEWIKHDKKWIEEKLHRSGAVLFRDCGVKSAADFNSVVEAFGYEEVSSLGPARRSQVVGRVFTANESPPDVYIPFHHEMALNSNYPLKLFFFCELAPTKGGETPLLWSHIVVERLSKEWPEFCKQLEEKGLLYKQYFSDNDVPNAFVLRSWKALLNTTDKREAENLFAEMFGESAKTHWFPEGGVMVSVGPVPAFKWGTSHGRKTFFNYMVLRSTTEYNKDNHVKSFENVCFGDGLPIPREAIVACAKIMEEEKVEFKWQEGDVLLIDNMVVQHARQPCFSPRRVLASLCK